MKLRSRFYLIATSIVIIVIVGVTLWRPLYSLMTPGRMGRCWGYPLGARFYSQSQEDEALYNHFFCGVRSGTYVELGALDGSSFSNTKFFEDYMGWKGVLIEAQPENAKLLHRNRPNAKVFAPMAICPEGVGSIDFLGGGGAVAGAVDTMSEKFMQRWHGSSEDMILHRVDCKPIGKLLREANVKAIDLFSLDVEGAELAVLETMDWAIPVHVWMIELDNSEPSKDAAVRRILTTKGYKKSLFDLKKWCPVGKGCTDNEVWVSSS